MFGLAPLSPWVWLIVGAVLAAGELLMPGVFLLWFGLAALVTAGVSATLLSTSIGLSTQLLIFAGAAVLSVAIGWLFWHRTDRRPDAGTAAARDLGDRRRFVVGHTGVVEEPITGGRGRVRLGDGSWSATGPDLPTGTIVRVTGIRDMVIDVIAEEQKSQT